MSDMLPADAAGVILRRGPGRPPKTSAETKLAADEAFAQAKEEFEARPGPMAEIIVQVKASEGWRCPWYDGRILKPGERLWVDLDTAEHMAKHELALILERKP